jgi:predicted esterase
MRSRPGWPYVLHVPEEYRGDEPYPLVFVLGGGPGRAMPTAQNARGAIEARGALAVFPQANGMWWDDASAEAFDALFAEVLAELNVDTDRVTITGFSNGGTGALLHAARHPDRFAAVAPLMGAGLPFFEPTRPIDVDAIARLPFLFVHGTRDETIPASASERTVKAILRENPSATAELHLLPGRGHDVVFGRDEGLTFPFLDRHVRDPFPKAVALRARGEAAPRAFWVAVVEVSGGSPSVDGTIDGQAIAVRTRGVRRLRLLLRPELVDFSRPVRVTIDGRPAFEGPVAADPAVFLRTWREALDPQLAAAAELVLDVR